MAFFKVVAVDFDGTLTASGKIAPETLQAMEQARRDGLRVVLVSGRIQAELQAEFSDIADQVDAMVLENGAVVVTEGRARALTSPVEGGVGEALVDRRVPFRCGEVLIAVGGEQAATVMDVIGELGLDYQITRNRGALMVLPAGITKGTGLATLLAEMNLSPHNVVAVDDAENDLSSFGVAEIGVAVANAVASVRRYAATMHDFCVA